MVVLQSLGDFFLPALLGFRVALEQLSDAARTSDGRKRRRTLLGGSSCLGDGGRGLGEQLSQVPVGQGLGQDEG
jgi:hypothetical protein